MSATSALLTAEAIWLVTGMLTAVFMGRRGHAAFTWWLLGTALGPLVLPLAVAAESRRVRHEAAVLLRGSPGTGPVDVLVGIDGSPAATAALLTALRVLDDRIGRLALASVLPVDDPDRQRMGQEAARGWLEAHARIARTWHGPGGPAARGDQQPELVLLYGHPATELKALAIREGFALLVVGARGRGLSTALLGSVATALASDAPVPVLLVGAAVTTGGWERDPAALSGHVPNALTG